MLIVNTAKISPEEFAKKYGYVRSPFFPHYEAYARDNWITVFYKSVSGKYVFKDENVPIETLYNMIIAGDVIKEDRK